MRSPRPQLDTPGPTGRALGALDRPLRVYLDSLGCCKNLVDSEAVLGLLATRGCESSPGPEDADVLVVNTCAFLETARQESVERILELAQFKTQGRARLLAVLGCLVSGSGVELPAALPEVDLWLPAGSHGDLPRCLQERLQGGSPKGPGLALAGRRRARQAPSGAFAGFESRRLLTPSHTAYLKISEGCSNTCSFCSIPRLRGRQRSRPGEEVRREVEILAARGVRELHVVAQDVTHYGYDLPGRPDLVGLLGRISEVEGIEWIRLLYAHPGRLRRELLRDLFAVPKVVRYLDLPVQHAAPRVLAAMRRRHSSEQVRALVDWLRANVPGVTLRSTVMVGHPGETESDFARLCRFVSEVRFDRLGILAYSREPGTLSYGMRGRPRPGTVSRRLQALTDLQMHVAAGRAAERVGSRALVLLDARLEAGTREALPEVSPLWRGAVAVGRSEGEALEVDGRIYVEPGLLDPAELQPGRFVETEITSADVFDLRARARAATGNPARERIHCAAAS